MARPVTSELRASSPKMLAEFFDGLVALAADGLAGNGERLGRLGHAHAIGVYQSSP